jgi:magnesium chelatase family protein
MIEAQVAVPAGFLNARIEGKALETVATPDEAGRALLVKAAERGGLSARGWTRTLRLARTIADLEGATAVRRIHIAEALVYRRTDPADAGVAAPRFTPA